MSLKWAIILKSFVQRWSWVITPAGQFFPHGWSTLLFIRYSFLFFFCRFRSFKYETDFKYLKLLSHKVIRFPLMARLGENFKADCSQLLLFFNQYYLKWERGGPWSIVLCFVWYVKSQWELQCKRHAFSFAFDAFSKRP